MGASQFPLDGVARKLAVEVHAAGQAQLVSQPLEPRPLGALADHVAHVVEPAPPQLGESPEQEVDPIEAEQGADARDPRRGTRLRCVTELAPQRGQPGRLDSVLEAVDLAGRPVEQTLDRQRARVRRAP